MKPEHLLVVPGALDGVVQMRSNDEVSDTPPSYLTKQVVMLVHGADRFSSATAITENWSMRYERTKCMQTSTSRTVKYKYRPTFDIVSPESVLDRVAAFTGLHNITEFVNEQTYLDSRSAIIIYDRESIWSGQFVDLDATGD
jgi:hypothetical protein